MGKWKRHSRWVTRSRRWKALRLLALRRDGFKCVECGAVGRLEVDHIQPVRTHPELAFDLNNLQSLCPFHHGQKTRSEVGLPPPNPHRRAWREAVNQLSKENVKCSNL